MKNYCGFIEVWKGESGFRNISPLCPIRALDGQLELNQFLGITTIAIFKIRLKTNNL